LYQFALSLHVAKRVRRELIKYMFQAWIKCSIVGYNISKEDIRILQNYIINLNEIKEIFVSDYDIYEFKSSDEPILTFIISFMKKLNILKVLIL